MEFTHTESVVVERSPEELYDLLTDIERTGEWSPVCVGCSWEDGAQAREGAWFTGRNETDGRSWQTRSEVVTAERGRRFAWQVGGTFVRWAYDFEGVEGGTRLTESWEFLPAGLKMFRDKYGDEAEAAITDRAEQAHAGIPVTLAAIKQVAEAA